MNFVFIFLFIGIILITINTAFADTTPDVITIPGQGSFIKLPDGSQYIDEKGNALFYGNDGSTRTIINGHMSDTLASSPPLTLNQHLLASSNDISETAKKVTSPPSASSFASEVADGLSATAVLTMNDINDIGSYLGEKVFEFISGMDGFTRNVPVMIQTISDAISDSYSETMSIVFQENNDSPYGDGSDTLHQHPTIDSKGSFEADYSFEGKEVSFADTPLWVNIPESLQIETNYSIDHTENLGEVSSAGYLGSRDNSTAASESPIGSFALMIPILGVLAVFWMKRRKNKMS